MSANGPNVIEEQRLKALLDYRILDTLPEQEFDSIARLAAYICKTPFALITFIDDQRQWVKSSVGIKLNQVMLYEAVCTYTIERDEVLQIKDALLDERFSDNELVNHAPYIRFYAGAPLINPEGYRIGSLCVLDTEPGELDAQQQDSLRILAAEVISRLEMRKSNREIKDTLNKYQQIYSMFDSSPELHCVMDRQTNILMVNRSVEKILGYTVAESIGHPIWHFLPEEDTYALIPVIEDKLRKGVKFFEVETRVLTKSGGHKWVGWSVAFNDGKWYANGRDITYQKKVVADLEMLSLAASKVDNGVIISNCDNNVIWANEAVERITGYNIADLKGNKLGDILKGEETDLNTLERARQLTKKKKSFEVDLLCYRKDGQPIWVSIFNSIILDKNGDVEKEVEIIVDITERKKAEEQLTLLSLVASKTVNGVVISDNLGKIRWVNEAFELLTGYTLPEIKGQRPGDFLAGAETDITRIEWSRKQSVELKPSTVEVLSYKKDQTPIWLSISNTPTFNADGSFEQQLEIVNDITERKLIEQELIKTREEALQLSKAKEAFLSVMSHEIRTPLNAVIGMTHVLMEDDPTESQVENLKILNFSAQNLLTLINDVLDFTKIETGNMVLEKADLNLKELVSQTLNTLQFKAVEKGIILKSEIDHRIPLLVKGDHTRLYQILINLLGNAVKFTDAGEIKLKLDLISDSGVGIAVRFEVSDTGIGIAPDKIDYIFNTYTQASSDTTRKYGGTGLGLAITKSLVELHDSAIFVQSEIGKGSAFSFTINFEKSNQSQFVASGTTKNLKLNSSILVVDDNYINRILAEKVLSKWGVTVDFAENGQIALEKVKKLPYDLILMDLQMPVMDGLEATREIRKLSGDYYRKLPIIALTASIVTNERAKIFDSGMNDYIMKPFVPAILYEKIKSHLN